MYSMLLPIFPPGAFLQSSWPRNGRIQFVDVSLQYEKTGQMALKNISCIIEAKEKV
jgi:ABC-type multidrug transport system fused ATPase/permease subunit